MSLQLLTPPAAEPVTLAEAKAHLKIDTSDEDALVATLITAARARAEWHTGRAFVTQRWRLRLDAWPQQGVIELPLPPLVSVEEVAVTDAGGIRSVLDPAAYRVDAASAPGRVIVTVRPPSLRARDGLEVAFTAGYGDASAVPVAIQQAILEVVADLYTHRGDDDPVGVSGQALLAPYRVFKL
ncbi:head-tail connector protein [Rhizomicrobium electricum]|uniref:Head-tail connector protein n=1 Tax=Rhizomicrobium electricum TaxID=480070 RepID=A0ABN1EHJ6_9PROT|nr:head-tail connector protein [Rhizomicrobium electricum]NIJ48430.1 putative phiE125 gp8 family phage protein [Rhizomicrobium electricum]